MAQSIIAEDLVGALYRDPNIKSRVGDRVLQTGHVKKASLPNIVISSEIDPKYEGVTIFTCRAATSAEADKVGAAVVQVITARRSNSSSIGWVKVQDRSGYDAQTKSFRRVIAVAPKAHNSK